MKKITITLTAFLLWSAVAFSQNIKGDSTLLKNELSIDIANILTFLSRKGESYKINYKRHLSDYSAWRFNLNLDAGSGEFDEKNIETKLGYELRFINPTNQRWVLFTGSDVAFAYSASNYQTSKTTQYGLIPFIGVNYFITKNFSVSTEIGLNMFYSRDRDPESYDPDDNADSFRIHIGSVGMFLVCYHFNMDNASALRSLFTRKK